MPTTTAVAPPDALRENCARPTDRKTHMSPENIDLLLSFVTECCGPSKCYTEISDGSLFPFLHRCQTERKRHPNKACYMNVKASMGVSS